MLTQLRLENISFTYPNSPSPLLNECSLVIPSGWSGVIGRNGCGKTTLLRLITRELCPDSGYIRGADVAWMCEQRTDQVPRGLEELFEDSSPAAWRLRVDLNLDERYLVRWALLSHGERKRAQVAAALWHQPKILLLDEPTNHLDRASRYLLLRVLRRHRGVGLVVSHDRELLNLLCERCISFENSGIVVRPGNLDAALEARDMERAAQRQVARIAQNNHTKLTTELQRRREVAAKAKSKGSKSGIARHDHDSKERINLARFTGKDAAQNRAIRQIAARCERADEERRGAGVCDERSVSFKFRAAPTGPSTILAAPPGELALSEGRMLRYPSLKIVRSSRVGIRGENGAGKSSLVAHLLASSSLLNRGGFYLPQEVSAAESSFLAQRLRAMDGDTRGRILGIVGRLGSDPKAVLASACPSPGETRKILIAEAIAREANILVLDEPTNHFDLDVTLCLEGALKEYSGALLMISHDDRLLRAVTDEVWEITTEGELVTK